jgi:hypothetical protein
VAQGKGPEFCKKTKQKKKSLIDGSEQEKGEMSFSLK